MTNAEDSPGPGLDASSIRGLLAEVNLEKVLLVDSFRYEELKGLRKLRGLLSVACRTFLSRPLVSSEGRKNGFLFVKSMHRKDYDLLFEAVVRTAPAPRAVSTVVHDRLQGPGLAPFRTVARYAATFARLDPSRPLRMLYLACRLCLYLEAVEILLRDARFKVLVVFADMHPVDNLLVQIAELEGLETVTLQHGLYVDYERCPNINRANYINIVSRHFLAWGEGTRALVSRFHPGCVVEVCGKPLNDDFLDAGSAPGEPYLTVIFDQNLLKDHNRQLLRFGRALAEETGVRLNLRPHPYNRLSEYGIGADTLLNAPLRGSTWILAHTSTLVHELLASGFSVLKMESDVPCLETPAELCFRSMEELRAIVARGPLPPERCMAAATRHIACTGESSRLAYAGFFKGLRDRLAPSPGCHDGNGGDESGGPESGSSVTRDR